MNKTIPNQSNFTSFYQLISMFDKYNQQSAVWTSDLSIKLSYKDLMVEIKNFSYLLSKVIKPGQRIVLLDLHGPHFVIAFFSIVLNKGIAVPIDQRMDKELQKEIIDMVGANLIITCKKDLKIKSQIIIYEELKDKNYNWIPVKIDPNIPAEIIFTSGTWGKPKGVVLTHNNLLSNLNSLLKVYSPNEGEKLLSVLPLSHAYEQMCGLLVPLSSGCHIIYQNSLDSFSLMESLQKFKVEYMVVVPKFLELLQNRILDNLGKSKAIFNSLLKGSKYLSNRQRRLIFKSLHNKFGSKLKTFIVGGAPLSNQLEDFFKRLGFEIIVGYGLSESSPVLSFSQENKRPKNSVGYPIPQVSIKIAEDGEIIASGPNIFAGYWPLKQRNIDETLYTGDLGYLDKKGRLFVTGRKKNLVVFSTGDKIQLEDIESMAYGIKGVDETCAISYNKNDCPIIVLVYTGTAEELIVLEYVNSKLPLYARIQKACKWYPPALPASHTLKFQRNVILKAYKE